jgi:hypothetical protein
MVAAREKKRKHTVLGNRPNTTNDQLVSNLGEVLAFVNTAPDNNPKAQ